MILERIPARIPGRIPAMILGRISERVLGRIGIVIGIEWEFRGSNSLFSF